MIIHQKLINREDLKANPGLLYVFGDNESRQGMGGQAGHMRGEFNAIGVATLSFGRTWNNNDWQRQNGVVDADLAPVVAHLLRGGVVVLPLDGIGTGIAQLAEKSSITFEHIQRRFKQLERVERRLFWPVIDDPAVFTQRHLRRFE